VKDFEFGYVVATVGVLDAVSREDIIAALQRHLAGDWGEVCDSDAAMNDEAVETYGRILSVYTSSSGTKFWIITEADRSCTTILLPKEY